MNDERNSIPASLPRRVLVAASSLTTLTTLIRRRARFLLDVIWLGLLSSYLLLGLSLVPFHADESTLVFMSRDYHYLVVEQDLERVLYREPALDQTEQRLRILNGTVAKMAMGFAWDLAGFSVNDLNENWVWAATVRRNRQAGNMPSKELLFAARLSSALLTVVALWAVFVAAWFVVAPGSEATARAAAWGTSLIFALDPVVLMNGRRAVMEGSFLCFTTLTLAVAFGFLRIRRTGTRSWVRRGATVALGVSAGLALASKHSAALLVATTLAALLVEPWIASAIGSPKPKEASGERRSHLLRILGVGALAAAVFFAANPAWWSAPFRVPGKVIEHRQTLLERQAQWLGGYESVSERLKGYGAWTFFSPPQYFEVPGWQSQIGEQIDAYDRSFFSGHAGDSVAAGVVIVLVFVGLASLVRDWRRSSAWVLLWVFASLSLSLIVLNPIPWQRYYLPLRPLVAILAGIGIGCGVRGLGFGHGVTSN